MADKPYPRLCRDCKYQIPEPSAAWNSRCTNPAVNARNPWALANTGGGGTAASSDAKWERDRRWFAPCGMSGKLWEPKVAAIARATGESRAAAALGEKME